MKSIFFIILAQLVSIISLGQETKLLNHNFSFTFGYMHLDLEKLPETNNLDFINYIDSPTPNHFEFTTLNLAYRISYSNLVTTDIKLILTSSLEPENFTISATYHFGKTFGMGVGFNRFTYYVSNFEQYQKNLLPDYYIYDENTQYFKAYDHSFYISPSLELVDANWLISRAFLDFGVSSLSGRNTLFSHKKMLSNEVLTYYYKLDPSYNLFLNPRIEFQIKLWQSKKNTFYGLQINSNYLYISRSLNYTKTIRRWTYDNFTEEKVTAEKHQSNLFNIEYGFVIKW